jgi:nanoRNase/pAp phosphatase (c-di-AMP/oligoRNAs hydrolase)
MSEIEEADSPKAEKKTNGRSTSSAGTLAGRYKDIDSLLQSKTDERVAIFAHGFPDPDAVGSMLSLKWLLLRKYQIESDLLYFGEVAHPQNATMCNLLDPGMLRVEDYVHKDYGLRILVDAIPKNAGVNGHEVEFDIVIDHHRDIPVDYNGILVHMKTGSCSAIVFDMMKKLCNGSVWFEHGVDFDTKVATALITGVMVDTNYLLSDDTTEYELRAVQDLFAFRDAQVLKEIVFFKRPKAWVDKKAQGCTTAIIDPQGYAIVGLGMIPEKQRDLLADMADDMLSWTSVETAIAFGIVGGDRIEGCIRSLNSALSVSDFCKTLGTEDGSGGGKQGKGAYRIVLSPKIDPDEDDNELHEILEVLTKREVSRILKLVK